MEYIVLNNGVKCPVIGIGTFMLSPAEAENSVRNIGGPRRFSGAGKRPWRTERFVK